MSSKIAPPQILLLHYFTVTKMQYRVLKNVRRLLFKTKENKILPSMLLAKTCLCCMCYPKLKGTKKKKENSFTPEVLVFSICGFSPFFKYLVLKFMIRSFSFIYRVMQDSILEKRHTNAEWRAAHSCFQIETPTVVTCCRYTALY